MAHRPPIILLYTSDIERMVAGALDVRLRDSEVGSSVEMKPEGSTDSRSEDHGAYTVIIRQSEHRDLVDDAGRPPEASEERLRVELTYLRAASGEREHRAIAGEIRAKDDSIDARSLADAANALIAEIVALQSRQRTRAHRVRLRGHIRMVGGVIGFVAAVVGLVFNYGTLREWFTPPAVPQLVSVIGYTPAPSEYFPINPPTYPLTPGKSDPYVHEQVMLKAEPPPDGWHVYALILSPGRTPRNPTEDDQTFFSALCHPDVPEQARLPWYTTPLRPGPMTVMVICVPDSVTEKEWQRAVAQIRPRYRHIMRLAPEADGAVLDPGLPALPDGTRLLWRGTSYELVDAETGATRSGAPQETPLGGHEPLRFDAWAGLVQELVKASGTRHWSWSGQSFMVRPLDS